MNWRDNVMNGTSEVGLASGLRRGSDVAAVRELLVPLLGAVSIDMTSQDWPTALRVSVRAGVDAAIGGGTHDLRRVAWHIDRAADTGYRSLLVAMAQASEVTVLVNGRRLRVPAGHAFITSSDVPVAVVQAGACTWRAIRADASAVHVPASMLDNVLHQAYPVGDYLRTLIEHALPEPGHRGDTSQVSAIGFDRYLASVVELVVRAAGESGERLTRDTARRRRVEGFIRQNLTDPQLTVSTIARVHSVSRRRLYQLFDSVDVGVAEFIRRARIERAKEMLVDPAHRKKSISQIAEQCGISSAPQFSRLFRSAVGMSPAAYRRQYTAV